MGAVAPTFAAALLALAALPAHAEDRGLHLGEEAQAAARNEARVRTEIHRFELETRKEESLRQVEAESSLRRAALAPTGLGTEGIHRDLLREREALDRRFYLDRRIVQRELVQVTRGMPELAREAERSLDRVEFQRRQRQVQRQSALRLRLRAQQQLRDVRSRRLGGGSLRGAFGRGCRR